MFIEKDRGKQSPCHLQDGDKIVQKKPIEMSNLIS